MADWQPDVLGDGYEQQVLELGDDPDGQGQNVGTLVRREAPEKPTRAVVCVHGFTDYFFQTALADFFADRGFAFFAPRPAQVRALAPSGPDAALRLQSQVL